jgi:hypothetical protein
MRTVPTRRLIWVPIIHTRADLGSLGGLLGQLYVRRAGQTAWNRHTESVEEMWEAIRRAVQALDLPSTGVRLYQDGLPDCGHEAEIVRDLAQAGSPNHQLLLDLMAKGATLTGTESPELLLEEYELTQQVLMTVGREGRGKVAQRQRDLGKALLEKRDRHIARRIDETLGPGETGLIFLGMLHSLKGLLEADVEVTRLRSARRLT